MYHIPDLRIPLLTRRLFITTLPYVVSIHNPYRLLYRKATQYTNILLYIELCYGNTLVYDSYSSDRSTVTRLSGQ